MKIFIMGICGFVGSELALGVAGGAEELVAASAGLWFDLGYDSACGNSKGETGLAEGHAGDIRA